MNKIIINDEMVGTCKSLTINQTRDLNLHTLHYKGAVTTTTTTVRFDLIKLIFPKFEPQDCFDLKIITSTGSQLQLTECSEAGWDSCYSDESFNTFSGLTFVTYAPISYKNIIEPSDDLDDDWEWED